MSISSTQTRKLFIVITVVIGVVALAVWWCWPRPDALATALKPLTDKPGDDQYVVAHAILDNFKETRSIASRWSGVYWGFTFAAAVFSALAALILKVESIFKNHQELKKDLAALLSVLAALLITLSTSGDFQRKWQANRVAAAELERTGYEFLENRTAEPRKYFSDIGNILHKRNLSIVGNTDQKKSEQEKNRSGK